MPQSLFHAFFCFSFPDLHVDVQGWNFQGADAAVLSLHIFGTCISRLLKIQSLDINMKVWEGETKESMKKGLGHYSSTSAWDGNIGVCGHNRGAKYTIGSIKDLEIGDTITYTTIYGTRTYEVVLVKTISNSDWSYLQATADNRITLTTCLANQPEKRICVQAVQITQ